MRRGARKVALNVVGAQTEIAPAVWPVGTVIEGIGVVKTQALKGILLAAAIVLLAVDILAALWVSGRLRLALCGASALVLAALALPHDARAQTPSDADLRAIEATRGVVLAYVQTGDAAQDRTSAAGLLGLGDQLWGRTSIEPDAPMAVNLETDELAFYPFLYWPITADQPLPSLTAYAKLNKFLRTGGMILFDTRDGDIAGLAATPRPKAKCCS